MHMSEVLRQRWNKWVWKTTTFRWQHHDIRIQQMYGADILSPIPEGALVTNRIQQVGA